jgi:hypothetical protein
MSVIMNVMQRRPVRLARLLLLALWLAACGDDDRVNPSNPDASPAKDAAIVDGSKDAGHDGAKDAGANPEDARTDAE